MITCSSNTPRPVQLIAEDFNYTLGYFEKYGYFKLKGEDRPARGPFEYNMISDPSLSLIYRTIAKQAKRPYVRYTEYRQRDFKKNADGTPVVDEDKNIVWEEDGARHATLIVPRRKYLSPIINPLVLAAQPREYRWHNKDQPAIQSWKNTRDIYFFLIGGELIDDFMEQVHTDPDMRKALKLPVT